MVPRLHCAGGSLSNSTPGRKTSKRSGCVMLSSGLDFHTPGFNIAVKAPVQLEDVLNLIHALVESYETLQMYPSYEKDGHPGEQSSSS